MARVAKVICPNREYNGISATVAFVNGVGETENPRLLDWFREKGYRVEAAEKAATPPQIPPGVNPELVGKTVEELKAYAAEKGHDIGNATSVNGILKKIAALEKAAT